MEIIDQDSLLNIQSWEDVQKLLSGQLGIKIRVTDYPSHIDFNHDPLYAVCSMIRNNPELAAECDRFHRGLDESDGRAGTCHAGFCHCSVNIMYFSKKLRVNVAAYTRFPGNGFINKACENSRLQPETLASVYMKLPAYPADKVMGFAELVAFIFIKVIEPATQTRIMYMAEKEKEDEINKLKLLMHYNSAMNSAKSLSQLLGIISSHGEKLVSAQTCILQLVDHMKNELYYEKTNSSRDRLVNKKRLHIGEGVAGIVAQTQIPLTINDISKEPRFLNTEELKGIKTTSLLCVPLKTGNKTIGIIKAVNKLDDRTFSPGDQAYMEAFAAAAAIAVENTSLYENMEVSAFVLNQQLEKANLNLSLEKRRIESVIKSMEDALLAIDRNKKIVLLNKQAGKLFNIRSKEARNAPFEFFIKRNDITEFFTKAVCSMSPATMDFIIPSGGEERIFAAVFTPIIDEDETCAGCVAVFRDITEIKKLDQLKSDFLNVVAHELRTPLTPILAYIQLLLIKAPPPEKVKQYASRMLRETQRLSTLIGDLLDLSRIESGKPIALNIEPSDISEIVGNVCETFQDASPKHPLAFKSPGPITADADKDRITQVLINLISNAYKYSPDGGEVVISLWEERGNVYVSVKDSGIGIPADKLGRIFEKYYRVQNKKVSKIQGAGIGLTIVQQIMECHKGGIKAESQEGKGSVFTFFIPKHHKEEQK